MSYSAVIYCICVIRFHLKYPELRASNPKYLQTLSSGRLSQLSESLLKELACCQLCPRNCQVNRLEGETGTCNTGSYAMVSSYNAHFGEESCLVGSHGSGTIFFTNCNLLCNFCQNYEISHLGYGTDVSGTELAAMMLELQSKGCHNINFVTPSHVIPQIVAAVEIACKKGLKIPLVYNSGGYDSVDSLSYLDGIIDIYMPDFKFSRTDTASSTCDASDYFEVAKKAIKEMHRQAGDLEVNKKGIAIRGLLVRHLVMPENAAGTEKIMEFLAEEISNDTYINIMDQYYPCGRIDPASTLNRSINSKEYKQALNLARSRGLHRFA